MDLTQIDQDFLYAYFFTFWFQTIFAYLLFAVLLHYVVTIFKKLFYPKHDL